MKKLEMISMLFMAVCVLTVKLSFAQPNIPKGNISKDIIPDVKEAIEALYSEDAGSRAYAAIRLGMMREKAVPAVPFLINMLQDVEKPKEPIIFNAGRGIQTASNPGIAAAIAIALIGKPAIDPLISALKDGGDRELVVYFLKKLTGQDFGEDQSKWKEWWQQNKSK